MKHRSFFAVAGFLTLAVGNAWPQTPGSFAQQAYLKASNTQTNDQFGYSVAVSGETLVIGAAFEDSNATGVNGDQANEDAANSGAAYIFVRSGTNWAQQAYLKASNTGGRKPLRLVDGDLGGHGGGRSGG